MKIEFKLLRETRNAEIEFDCTAHAYEGSKGSREEEPHGPMAEDFVVKLDGKVLHDFELKAWDITEAELTDAALEAASAAAELRVCEYCGKDHEGRPSLACTRAHDQEGGEA